MTNIDSWPHYPSARGKILSGADPANPDGWRDNLDTIQTAVNSKADQSALDAHTNAASPHSGHATNAFSAIAVVDSAGQAKAGSPVSANTTGTTYTLKEGDGITLTPDDANKTVTVAAPGAALKQVTIDIIPAVTTGYSTTNTSYTMVNRAFQFYWDPANYPASASWYLEVMAASGAGSVAVYEYDTGTGNITGSALGTVSPPGGVTYSPYRIRSNTFTMPATAKVLTIAHKYDNVGGSFVLHAARIIGIFS